MGVFLELREQMRSLVGRGFQREETEGDLDVVVLTEGFWARRFARDPRIVGRSLDVNGRPRTIVGVVPFDFGSLLARHERDGLQLSIQSFDERVRGALRPTLLLLAWAVGIVGLIVYANLASLQIARAAARQRENAIRLALGGRRAQVAGRRLLPQMRPPQRRSEIGIRMALGASAAEVRKRTLASTLVLVGLGVVLGFVVSLALERTVATLLYGVSGHDPLTYGVGVLVMTLIALLAGLVPAQRAARTDPLSVLKVS